MSGLPPLPKIEGDIDLMLDVYTHSSLRMPETPMNDDYGDTPRLRELGQRVLELVVTYHLFNERPMLRQDEIQTKREYILADTNIDLWLKQYGLKDKLRAAPLVHNDVMSDAKEMSTFFYIYVGALYTRNGLTTVQNWISQLIDPVANVNPPGGPQPAFGGTYHSQTSPPQGGYYTPPQPAYAQPQSQYFPPPPPSNNPPPLPSSPTPYSHGPASTLSLVTLALVNQTAAQRSIAVTYPAEQTGPPINQPGHQKIAKEEAARQAWAAMGWGPT
ncbi:hypothetical protein BJ912DRAFT_941196 [Pholiota molesta]|nr:hypothetical protein BJ912DRAFT_941196 [Pholiota molesta]